MAIKANHYRANSMAKQFDPYFEWLGIPPKHQPPNHYRLLNLDAFEDDDTLIAAAAQRVTARLREIESGDHEKAIRKILREVMAAGSCLLDDETKADYDRDLRECGGSETATSLDDDDLKLAPLADQPTAERSGSTPARQPPPAVSIAEPPVAMVDTSGTHATTTSFSGRQRARSKQNPAVLTGLLVLLLAVCGVALYFVVIAPPASDKSDVAESDGKQRTESGVTTSKRAKPTAAPRKPKNSNSRDSRTRTIANGSTTGPRLDPIDAVGAMPRTKSLPASLVAIPLEDAGLAEPEIDEPSGEDQEEAQAIWKEARAAVGEGDVKVAIEKLEQYILHQGSVERRDEAEQLLMEARAAIPDAQMAAAIFMQLSDFQLDQLLDKRLTIRLNFEFTHPVMSEIFHKTLREKVPAEKQRRAERKNPVE